LAAPWRESSIVSQTLDVNKYVGAAVKVKNIRPHTAQDFFFDTIIIPLNVPSTHDIFIGTFDD
jgi:hypothetical protein